MKDFKIGFTRYFHVIAVNEEEALSVAAEAINYDLQLGSHTTHTFFDNIETEEFDVE